VFSVGVHATEESWGIYWESWGEGVVGERREEVEEVNDVVGDSLDLDVSILVKVDAPVSVAQATSEEVLDGNEGKGVVVCG
jgi:hypothetical protein